MDSTIGFDQIEERQIVLYRSSFVRMVMLLLGKDKGKQRITGRLPESNGGRQTPDGHSNVIEYAFTVKKAGSKITVHPESSGLPKVAINVRLAVSAFELGEEGHTLKQDYVNQMEKKLGDHLDKMAKETIGQLQKANCDLLGIGEQIKAFHPTIWKSLDWRKDYPQLSIEPNVNVQILNTETE